MTKLITFKPIKHRGKKIRPQDKVYRQFEMFEWEIEDFDEEYFHHSLLEEREYHNAYDADENGILFRADAIFKHDKGEFEVPVFASKDRKGNWKWLIRFRPHLPGKWELWLFVLHWHTRKHPKGEPKDSKKEEKLYGKKTISYYEHLFGPEQMFTFRVDAKKSYLEGPLEKPDPALGHNSNYFYRRGTDGQHKPYFLFGFARPWVTKTSPKLTKLCTKWDSFLRRKEELFKPMAEAGCNVLYHWMAPGETQLVHQAEDESWPKWDERLPKTLKDEGYFSGKFPGKKLSVSKMPLAYKRYDQGRAFHTDNIFDQAKITTKQKEEKQILIFLAVMPHSLLQDGDGTRQLPDGTYPGHHWEEWAWKEHHPKRKYKDPKDGKKKDIPNKLNGFHFFRLPDRKNLSIEQFFQMEPGKDSWENQLWKHFANYWRYIIGRWTAHPALGAWVLMDELEGVGTDSTWWWDKHTYTYKWHDNLVQMMKGKMKWGTVRGIDMFYTGDYLKHPMTSSTTHYEGSSPDWYLASRPVKRKALQDFRKTGNSQKALQLIETFGELKDHADWLGNPASKWKTDFISHHAYQAVPYWGHWDKCYNKKTRTMQWRYWNNKQCPLRDKKGRIKKDQYNLVLPNEEDLKFLAPNRWLWDSLCMRLRNWSKVNKGRIRLVTEYGCLERNCAYEKVGAVTEWNRYGKRVPSFTHFANWSALVLGHAGIPFKWNDGAEHGEMAAHPRSKPNSVWHINNYPVDNYKEIKNVAYFLSRFKVNLGELYPEELEIVDKIVDKNDRKDKNFNAWALVDKAGTKLIAWIYDRTFTTNGQRPNRKLKIKHLNPDFKYRFTWYDTWKGRPLARLVNTSQPDKDGTLLIELESFPKTNDETITGDGNDIAIYLSALLPRS